MELEGNKFHEVHCPDFTVKDIEVHERETISQTVHGDSTIKLNLESISPSFYSGGPSTALCHLLFMQQGCTDCLLWAKNHESYGKKMHGFSTKFL